MSRAARAHDDTAAGLGYDGGLHCDLRVSDLGRSLDWYTGVLGFEVIHHFPEHGWCELQSPVAGMKVGLSEVEDVPTGGGAVLTFGVRDLDEARRRLEALAVRFDGDTCEIEGFVRLATIYDPDGNVLMLYQDLEPAARDAPAAEPSTD